MLDLLAKYAVILQVLGSIFAAYFGFRGTAKALKKWLQSRSEAQAERIRQEVIREQTFNHKLTELQAIVEKNTARLEDVAREQARISADLATLKEQVRTQNGWIRELMKVALRDASLDD